MERAFLDANVLFSAADKTNASLTKLWHLSDVEFVTSTYAAEEATRNIILAKPDRLSALRDLLKQTTDFGSYYGQAVGGVLDSSS